MEKSKGQGNTGAPQKTKFRSKAMPVSSGNLTSMPNLNLLVRDNNTSNLSINSGDPIKLSPLKRPPNIDGKNANLSFLDFTKIGAKQSTNRTPVTSLQPKKESVISDLSPNKTSNFDDLSFISVSKKQQINAHKYETRKSSKSLDGDNSSRE